MSTTISRDEWLAALGETAPQNDPNALTLGELAVLFGVGRMATQARVDRLIDQGKAERTEKIIVRAASGAKRVPAYRLVVKPKAKK